MKELQFTNKSALKLIMDQNPKVMNFQNMYSLYLFRHNETFRKEILRPQNITFADGSIVARYLHIKQQRGPSFTRTFLLSKEARKKKHFFIGNTSPKEIAKKTKINIKKITTYNPPFIKKSFEFPMKEKVKMQSLLKKSKPDIVWVCIGNPKQEILANQLYSLYPCTYVNVGAALDFLLEKKQEAPRFFRFLSLEWFYRLITDFSYSRKKVWRSFVALLYLKQISLRH